MRRLVVAALSLVALMSAADLAQARDGCGAGRYYNGYRCVSMGGSGYYGPGPGFYEPGPRYYRPGPGYYGPPPGAYRGRGIYIDRNGQPACRQRGFTVQDGVCKPYRGY